VREWPATAGKRAILAGGTDVRFGADKRRATALL
jgi:hypothetical protein